VTQELNKAKNYAFLLLKFRPRSINEIETRLKEKGYTQPTVKETLDFLKDKKFLDDDYFARAWIEWRLKKPFGLRRIRQELEFKGVDREIVESNIDSLKENYSEEKIVRLLIAEIMKRLKTIEPKKAKSRIFSWLLRRGFSQGIVIDAVREL
jgi:regulatory protein